jgi:large subunit ribosomal protein L5
MSEKDSKKGKSAKDAKGGGAPKPAGEPKKPKGKQGEGRQQAAEVLDERPSGPKEPARLQTFYRDQVMNDLTQQFGYKSRMEVPRIEKIVVNMGVGAAVSQPSLLEGAQRDLEQITGQKPIVTRAKKSIAGFKLREGNAIGAKVTLRGDRMWEFFDRLLSLAIPRIRDFRGLPPNSFDGRGNYTFGVTEQLIFPEIDYDKVDAPRGMDITIVTTARTNAEGRALLDAFGFPFKREGQQ